jgi:putative flippase GtrA
MNSPVPSSLAPPMRLLRDFLGYGFWSAAALGVDWGLLILLVTFGLPPLAATATSFTAGMVFAYATSVRFVFADSRTVAPWREALTFFAIGFVGLALNQALIAFFMVTFGLGAAVAKAPTAILVFLFNFLARRAALFAPRPAPERTNRA